MLIRLVMLISVEEVIFENIQHFHLSKKFIAKTLILLTEIGKFSIKCVLSEIILGGLKKKKADLSIICIMY